MNWKRPDAIRPPFPDYALQIKHAWKSGSEQTYLLTGDEHWDSPECYLKLLLQHLDECRERNGLWISNGDLWDAISSRDDRRGSKGTLREEHCKTNYLDQLVDDAIDTFRPYLGMLIYIGTGNHEQKITIQKETDLTARFCEKANAIRKETGIGPIHRAGYAGAIRFQFNLYTSRLSHSAWFQHGNSSGQVTKGVIGTGRRAAAVHGMSLYVTSHIHEQWCLNNSIVRLNDSTGRIEQHKAVHVQLGSYKSDFRPDGAATWYTMMTGGSSPKPIGGSWLRFYAPTGRRVDFQVTDTGVDYPNLPDYLARPHVGKRRAA